MEEVTITILNLDSLFCKEWILQNRPTLSQGECSLSSSLANSLDVKEGDIVQIFLMASYFFEDMWRVQVRQVSFDYSWISDYVWFPVKVVNIFEGTQGKVSVYERNSIIMEYKTFLPYIARHLHPYTPLKSVESLQKTNLYHYAMEILWNFPPPRAEVYADINLDSIKY